MRYLTNAYGVVTLNFQARELPLYIIRTSFTGSSDISRGLLNGIQTEPH